MNNCIFNTADNIALSQQKVLASKLHSFRSSLLQLIFIALSLLVSYPLPGYADNLPANDGLNQATIAMNTAMSSTPMIGNPDVDFAVMMIAHHHDSN
ncbi:MAG TPA: hypothetical protein V6D11_25045 [Waterburya sp.]|jgi:hypothetical protein